MPATPHARAPRHRAGTATACLVLALALTACSGDDEEGTAAPTAATVAPSAPAALDSPSPRDSPATATAPASGTAAPDAGDAGAGAAGAATPAPAPGATEQAPPPAPPADAPAEGDPTDALARAFTDALAAGSREDGARLATPEVVSAFEPWEARPGASYTVTGPGAFTVDLGGQTATCEAGSRLVVSCAVG